MITSNFQMLADNPKNVAIPNKEKPKQSRSGDTDDELEDIDLYYKAFNRNKPEPEEPMQNLLPDTK